MVEKYSYKHNKDNYITSHFKIKEFASIEGKKLYSDIILIDTEITSILEKLHTYMNAYKVVITSGYRTKEHEKNVGNKSGKGYHTTGQAVDINVWKDAKKRFKSREIALALENLGWKKGIGLISETAVHIDTRITKYYFNEMNNNKSIGSSFYKFYGIEKEYNEIDVALDKLIEKKIINNKEYWKENYNKVKYLDDLIIKVAKRV